MVQVTACIMLQMSSRLTRHNLKLFSFTRFTFSCSNCGSGDRVRQFCSATHRYWLAMTLLFILLSIYGSLDSAFSRSLVYVLLLWILGTWWIKCMYQLFAVNRFPLERLQYKYKFIIIIINTYYYDFKYNQNICALTFLLWVYVKVSFEKSTESIIALLVAIQCDCVCLCVYVRERRAEHRNIMVHFEEKVLYCFWCQHPAWQPQPPGHECLYQRVNVEAKRTARIGEAGNALNGGKPN